MTEKLKELEKALTVLTEHHQPELSIAFMEATGQKLINHEKNADEVTLFTEASADRVYTFMRNTIGKNPFIIE